MTAQPTWTQHQQATAKQTKKLFKLVDTLIALKNAGKSATDEYTTYRAQAITICESIGEDFTDFAEYYHI